MRARSKHGKVPRIACALLISVVTQDAWATNPLNSRDRTSSGTVSDEHTNFNVVPIIGGNTDVGIGGGAYGGLARLKQGFDPYVWNIDMAALVTFKTGEDGFQVPFQDVYAKWTVPRLFGLPVRFEIRPSYTWESTLGYYGIGNASTDAKPPDAPGDYFRFGRVHPKVAALVRFRIVDHVAGKLGLRYTHNWLEVHDASRLAEDLRGGSRFVKDALGRPDTHGVFVFQYGVQWDNRDSEVSTHSGFFHELDFYASPGGTSDLPYRYGQGALTLRGFFPVFDAKTTFAARTVFNVLVGDAPFYELARFDDTYALGGTWGVRGIPAQRYQGKVKAFGNLELRREFVSFRALGKSLLFGAVVFVDAGRVWADLGSRPELDGRGVGLKFGTGGGLRLQSGETFVLRLDAAWSPDARPLGAYFGVGQMF